MTRNDPRKMTVGQLDKWIEYGSDSDSDTPQTTFHTTQVHELLKEEPKAIKTEIFYKKGNTKEERKKTEEVARLLTQQILSGEAKIIKEKVQTEDKEDKEDKENVTFKSLLKKPRLKSPTNRAPVGIRKAGTNIITDPEAVKIIKENHDKKEQKRKKLEEKKEIEKKAVKKAQTERRLRLRPRKDNPKL